MLKQVTSRLIIRAHNLVRKGRLEQAILNIEWLEDRTSIQKRITLVLEIRMRNNTFPEARRVYKVLFTFNIDLDV